MKMENFSAELVQIVGNIIYNLIKGKSNKEKCNLCLQKNAGLELKYL